MSRIFFMSDIHGMYYEFMDLLDEIQFGHNDFLYILGDVIDRGYGSIKLLQYIMEHENIELLLGNHEHMMMDSFIVYEEDKLKKNFFSVYFQTWIENGGQNTYSEFKSLCPESRLEIYKYLESLETYKILKYKNEKIFLSHAGVDASKGIYQQDLKDLIWSKDEFYYKKGIRGYFFLFGHTPTKLFNSSGKSEIWFDNLFKDKICLDCDSHNSKKIGCIEISEILDLINKPVS